MLYEYLDPEGLRPFIRPYTVYSMRVPCFEVPLVRTLVDEAL